VTLEMAQRLSSMGEEVALLAMLDSYPHPRYLAPRERLRLRTRSLRRRALSLAGAAVSRFRPPEISGKGPSAGARGMSAAVRRVRDCANQALARYRPRFYPGRIRFVRAAEVTGFPADPIPVWSGLAKEFLVETVSGDHLGMMTTHFKELARTLSFYVLEAQAKFR